MITRHVTRIACQIGRRTSDSALVTKLHYYNEINPISRKTIIRSRFFPSVHSIALFYRNCNRTMKMREAIESVMENELQALHGERQSFYCTATKPAKEQYLA